MNTMKFLATCALVCLGCRGSLENGGPTLNDDAGGNNVSVNGQTGNNVAANNVAANNNVALNNGTPDGGSMASDMPEGADITEAPFDAGACGAAGFGESFSVVEVTGTAAQGRLHATATSGGGAVLGWRDGSGVHVTHVDGAGAVITDSVVAGDELYGLAAHDGGRAVMVSRGSDILALVILDAAGNPVSDQTIIGGVDHNVTENEWFGPLIREGTMTWTGTQWAPYFTVQRLWSDGVAHYGDQLRLYEADGSSNSMVWGWGCSHSMEVKISHNGQRLGPVCSSDCFPSKGVHFNHRGGQLWPDDSGSNCAGQYGTSLGASVPVADGFWLAFTARDQRQSADVAIARVTGSSPGEPVWLTADTTADSDLHATSLDGDIVVAWNAGGQNQFALVGAADGATLAGPVSVGEASLAGASDFFVFANGDVGWAQRQGSAVGLARLKACR